MRKSSFAVLPSNSFNRVGSCRPGTWTRMRSKPWLWIEGSTVPSSFTRRSTIWIDCSTTCRMRSVIAASVMVRRMTPPPASTTSTLRWPVALSRPPSGWDRSRSLASACGVSLGSRRRTSTVSPRTKFWLARRASRSTRRTSSRRASTFCRRTSVASTCSRMCEPPCRSRPSTMWRCAHFGHDWTVRSGKKLGTANRHTTAAVSSTAITFHREKNSMDPSRVVPDQRRAGVAPRARPDNALAHVPAKWAPVRRQEHAPLNNSSACADSEGTGHALARRALVLDRLSLCAHVGEHRAQLPHPQALGDLDLDLGRVVVDLLGDLADQAAGGHDRVAPAHVLEHFLMLLLPLLLWAQNQEVHDHEDQDDREQRHQHVAAAALPELSISGRDQHRNSSGVSARLASPTARPAAEIGADYTGRRPNCNGAQTPVKQRPNARGGRRGAAAAACGCAAAPLRVRPMSRPGDIDIAAFAARLERIAAALDRLAPAAPAGPRFAAADAFVWHPEGRRLDPVPRVNRVDMSLLKGIDRVRDLLLENTERFARGLPANNALLWGARGMGKSSLVKAV